MNSSSFAARLWSRAATFGRDSFSIANAFAKEVKKTRQLGDAWRGVLVTQARKSNQVANSVLSLQQQIGLIRYHGFLEYWRQHRPALLNAAGTAPNSSSGTATMSTSTTTRNPSGSVAKVAFMITASMRKELTEKLGYTADQIKSFTPVEASLVLHHQLLPEEKDQKLPALLEAHKSEQEKAQKELAELEKQKRLEQEKREQSIAAAAAAAAAVQNPMPVKESDAKPAQAIDSGMEQEYAKVSIQSEPNEGLKPQPTGTQDDKPIEGENTSYTGAPLGSFVQSMEERADTTQEWFEIIETRTNDGTSSAVALYHTEEEANEVMKLKADFANRRAEEDKDNVNNEPETTYSIRKTLK